MKIADKNVVTLEFELFDRDGGLIDSSQSNGPLVYLHGAEQLLQGLEDALAGQGLGEELSVELAPEQAFGQREEGLVDRVSRENFPGVEHIEAGMRFQTEMEDGSPMLVTVTEVDEEWVTVDGNHELAGRHLRFELKVADIRPATPEELEHGHVHGEGGHSH